MENSPFTEYDTKLENLLSMLTPEQRLLFDEWQETNLLINSLVAVENRRAGFEEGLKTALELQNTDA